MRNQERFTMPQIEDHPVTKKKPGRRPKAKKAESKITQASNQASTQKSPPTQPNKFPRFSVKVESITPRLAVKYLERNVDNRPITKSYVNNLVRQMQSENWHMTHQGIAFAKDGRLIDGQHRLQAIIESGKTVKLPVTRGLSEEAIMVLDTHKKRNAADAAHYVGLKDVDTRTMAAAASMERGLGSGRIRPNDEQVLFFKKHEEAIRFAMKVVPQAKGGEPVANAPLRGAIARAYYHVGHGFLRKFAHVVLTGESDDERFKPALQLRDIMLKLERKPNAGRTRRENFSLATMAIHMAHEKVSASRLNPAQEELFPLPEEQSAIEQKQQEMAEAV